MEYADEAGNALSNEDEPLLELVHGLPGAGKSEVIWWLHRYFEYVWRWKHGVQFVCLAPMNGMATNVGGFTVHSWGEVGFCKDGVWICSANTSSKNPNSMVTKCSCLRFLIIDEIENLDVCLLADLERNVFAGMPDRLYKWRAGSSAVQKERLFAGVNLLLVGDFWQLDPVGGISIMKNPFRGAATTSEKAQRILNIFWGSGPDTITKPPLELSVNIRSRADVWYSSVIDECRRGRLTEENYNFLHGYPTNAVGSYLSITRSTMCGDSACEKLMNESWPDNRRQGVGWNHCKMQECEVCQQERERRNRLMGNELRDLSPGFAAAPYITHMNRPRYMASQERTILFARYHKRQLLWVRANDMPTSGDIKGLHGDALQAARENWWKRHDQHTNGIMGLMPLVYGLPERFTRTVDPLRKIHKFTRGVLIGWELHDYDAEAIRGNAAPEIILQRCPKRLFIRVNGTNMPQHYNLEPQVFALCPRRVTWSVDPDGTNQLLRTGFPVVPDFGATIHSVCGQQFSEEILDLKPFSEKVNLEAMIMAYIGMSRVKRADGLLLVEPFSPCLFQQNAMPGPSVLMRYLRGQEKPEVLKDVLENLEETQHANRPTLKNMKWIGAGAPGWRCGRCEAIQSFEKYTTCEPDEKDFLRRYRELILERGQHRF